MSHRDDRDYAPVDHGSAPSFIPITPGLPIEYAGVDVEIMTVFEEVAFADLQSRCGGDSAAVGGAATGAPSSKEKR